MLSRPSPTRPIFPAVPGRESMFGPPDAFGRNMLSRPQESGVKGYGGEGRESMAPGVWERGGGSAWVPIAPGIPGPSPAQTPLPRGTLDRPRSRNFEVRHGQASIHRGPADRAVGATVQPHPRTNLKEGEANAGRRDVWRIGARPGKPWSTNDLRCAK
jgi:hypothetical protein